MSDTVSRADPIRVVGLTGGDIGAESTIVGPVDANDNVKTVLYDGDGNVVTYDDLIETKSVKVDIAVDTAAYADNDSIGGLKTLTDFAREAAGSGTFTRFQLRTKLNLTAGSTIYLHLFDANPSASTFTDNAALVIHADDETKLLKSFTIAAADWTAPRGQNPWYTTELIDPSIGKMCVDYQLASGRDLYFAIEADGAVDFVAAGDLKAIVAAQNN